ncbi:btb poz-like protein [Stemphylium lycopersici]|uniref:Btb poz-like protein n=1 Tax=Stemphylium lycopersici TaxID=183478 RepID=A0A364N3A5_STELY|nr:btb poz-like protein [Stemphylium lycopersici]RAR10317.1 btb poz-like protein [Stemphylium lycopersici]
MTEAFTINVGGRSFTTLKSTLERSPFLATLLSSHWAGSTCYFNGVVFVDRSPLLFEHILDFLRSSAPPIFWTRTNGFDLPLYASLLREAEYFQIEALAIWIRNRQYINAIWITASIEVVPLSDCGHGKSHYGDIEKEFEPGDLSKPGKSTTVYKRLLLQKTQLQLPFLPSKAITASERALIMHQLLAIYVRTFAKAYIVSSELDTLWLALSVRLYLYRAQLPRHLFYFDPVCLF